jgi:RND family efflux transporter MFP subunit
MKRVFRTLAFLAFVVLPCGACKHEETGSAGPEQPTVVVTKPVSRSIVEYATFTGQIQATNDVEVRARVTGYLKKICYKPSDEVEDGALLFLVDPDQYQAQFDQANAKLATSKSQVLEGEAKVVEAETQLDLDKAKLAIDEEVAKTAGALSKQRLIESRAKVKLSEASIEAAKSTVSALEAAVEAAEADLAYAKLNLDWTEVKAPIGGRVDRNLLTVGNLVTANVTVLTNIVTTEEVYAYFNVNERTYLDVHKKIREGTYLNLDEVPVGVGLQDEEGYPHEGTFDLVANSLGTGTGTMQVRAIFKNPRKVLTPGNFVRVRVPVDKAQERLLVPDRAVISDQGEKFLLIVNDSDEVEKRKIKAGPLDPDDKTMRVVHEGVGDDERVIVQGRQRVRPGTTVKVQAAPENGGKAGVGG